MIGIFFLPTIKQEKNIADMARRLETPVDDLTGIPLPLLFGPGWPTQEWGQESNGQQRRSDLHHAFHDRARVTSIGRAAGGQALLHCRTQRVGYKLHHDMYHVTYSGPKLPSTPQDTFKTVVFAAARSMPEKAISFDADGNAREVSLSPEERGQLLGSSDVGFECKDVIKKFLLDFVIRHGSSVPDWRLALFLDCNADSARRLEVFNDLVELASYEATEPIRPAYIEAQQSRLLPCQQISDVGGFVCGLLTQPHYGGVCNETIEQVRGILDPT